MQIFFLNGLWRLLRNGHLPVKLHSSAPPPPGAIGSSDLVGRKSKCYFIIKFSLLLSIRLCWREIRPDAGKTIENEFVASFL